MTARDLAATFAGAFLVLVVLPHADVLLLWLLRLGAPFDWMALIAAVLATTVLIRRIRWN